MQLIIFHKADVPGPLLRRGPLWFDSCKRPPPISDHSVFAFWVVAHGSGSTVLILSQTVDMWWSKWGLLSINCIPVVILKISNLHFSGKENLWSVWPIIKAWCFFAFMIMLFWLLTFGLPFQSHYKCTYLEQVVHIRVVDLMIIGISV